MENATHRRDYTKLALVHLCLGIAEALQFGLVAALPLLVLSGVYLHIAVGRRHPTGSDGAGRGA